jgi:site-specific DNA-cytosine methylase
MLTAFSRVTEHRAAPRVWIESHRLSQLGLDVGTPYDLTHSPSGVTLTASALGSRFVSYRRANGTRRPIIDLNSRGALGNLSDCPEVKMAGSYGRLHFSQTVRAAYILRGRQSRSVYRWIDFCCGGSTASQAFSHPRFQLVGGVEIDPGYADEFARQHPEAELFLGDMRLMHASELPEFDGFFMGVPCDDHSAQGRAKKGLAGSAETGRVGDLYLSAISIVSARMPAFAVFENVPSFGASLAGRSIVAHLTRLGYSVAAEVLDAHADYAEPSPRRRWFCVATLKPGFAFENPHQPFTGTLADYLDAPDAVRDQADAERIAVTIAGLKRHAARHAAAGHRFGLHVVDHSATLMPTLLKTYPKINSSGTYVSTPFGERMLRPAEVCRIHGHTFTSTDPRTVLEMSGQGVLTRQVRTAIAEPLARFLP